VRILIHMVRLVLFDIDGTLVKRPGLTGGKAAAFEAAVKAVAGTDVTAVDGWYEGLTDQLIMAELLRRQGWAEEDIVARRDDLNRELDAAYSRLHRKGDHHVLPGVIELLDALTQEGTALGLITGNTKPTAQRKLEAVELWSYFPFGGFGDDVHERRSDLVRVAMKRAQAVPQETAVLGDTPRDISAAAEAGVGHNVGVATGPHPSYVLKKAGADHVFEDLSETQLVMEKLGF
jgi:phosphoglycolate phosphatase